MSSVNSVSCCASTESSIIPESYVTHVVRKLISAVLYMHKHLKMVHLDIKVSIQLQTHFVLKVFQGVNILKLYIKISLGGNLNL